MSYKTIEFHVRGVAPLLMHNGQLANPMNQLCQGDEGHHQQTEEDRR